MSGPFHETVRIYDIFYSSLGYAEMAGQVGGLIRERCPGAVSLLDVGCGTGRHLEVLRNAFPDCEGVDIDPAMLAVATTRLPGVPLHEADMEAFDLGRRFDAVICMFSSIGYAHTPERMAAAIGAMASHLNDRGVLVVEPWLAPDMIREPLVRMDTAEAPGVVVARSSRMRVDGKVSSMEFGYLVTTSEGSDTFVEEHVMGLFTADEYTAAVKAVGLEAEFVMPGPLGRGLAIGVRPGGG